MCLNQLNVKAKLRSCFFHTHEAGALPGFKRPLTSYTSFLPTTMNRIGNDELLAHSPNLTFRSSFSLSGNAIEQDSKKSLSTALCGLGWYFTLRFVAGKGLKKGGKSKVSLDFAFCDLN